ncbi:hypothetical protein ACFP3Q_04180 [Nocardioides sp. GCM10027113]|uniref:hypothetical protein n=1 Tax=unclassified Nocardioides TaxID=2615069 RepID=UPI003617411A
MLVRHCAAALLLAVTAGCGIGGGTEVADPAAATGTTPAPSGEPSATAPAETPTGASEEPTATEPPKPKPSRTRKPPKPGTRIVVSDSQFGPMLFDATGQAIYLFDIERTSRSRCYGECAVAWPPVLTQGKPVAGRGVDGSLLGTTKRTDGTIQVTYNDHPLYFYAHEGKREVRCHDVFLNGGDWYVVQPSGDAAPPG